MLSADLITRFAPRARADIVQGLVDGWPRIHAAGITTSKRLQHFMAEISHESGHLTTLEERLDYSASRLRQVWPTRFPSVASAEPYARNPRALANRVYGGRYGNTGPDDGWRYRGGGLIQTTFRANYRAAGFEDDPDAVRSMPGALDAALEFWTRNKLNALVDAGDLAAERKRINGGVNGLEEVRLLVGQAATVFTRVVPPAASAPLARTGPEAPLAAPPPPARAGLLRPARLVQPEPDGAPARLLGWLRRALG